LCLLKKERKKREIRKKELKKREIRKNDEEAFCAIKLSA